MTDQTPQKSSTNIWAEAAGWYGTVAIVLAYMLVSFKVIESDSLPYQLLNLTGALGIVAVSLVKRVKQPAVLNMFWAAIAFVALLSIIF